MKSIRISSDDACASDLRLAELAKKYEVECVFYWPVEWQSYAYSKGFRPLNFAQALEISADFEVGSHTITHRLLTQLDSAEAKREIADSQLMLQNLLGKEIDNFCPPRGYTNPDLTDFTLEYYQAQRLTRGENLVHIHPNSGANDNQPWQSRINANTEELWCHSWELDRYNLWAELESYLASTFS